MLYEIFRATTEMCLTIEESGMLYFSLCASILSTYYDCTFNLTTVVDNKNNQAFF